MTQVSFHSANWYQALTLAERLVSLSIIDFPNDVVDVDLVNRRMERWQLSAPEGVLDGLDNSNFRYILGESQAGLQQRVQHPPRWLKKLQQAFSANSPKIKVVPPAQLQSGKESFGFLYAMEPLISLEIGRLETSLERLVEKYTQLPFEVSTVKGLLFAKLPEQLLTMLTPTMVLELNVASLQGLLSGETSQERFLSFIERLYNRENAIILLQEYPVLARQLVIGCEQWADFSIEFLQNLCTDWEDICNTFSPQKHPGVLVGVKSNAGDSHCGGRSVLIAQFSSGLEVVYKPKSLAVDVHFQELLSWLNQQGTHPSFQTLRIINRGNYGWVEFIAAKSCDSIAQIQSFYQRLGGYLALLYALEATDFHSENLIASGENPVLIDLESLFHSRSASNNVESSTRLGWEEMTYSVLRVGLLPQRSWANANSEGVDISGVGATAGQILPNRTLSWEKVATDEMRLVRQSGVMEADNNQPRLLGEAVNVLDYAANITAGFTVIYQLLLQHQDEFINLVSRCAEDEIRVILRPTRTYALLLQESFHPDVLQNALERDRLFERLWLAVQHQPHLKQVIAYERACLWDGDIPFFFTHPNSCNLFCGDGKCIPNFFATSGMELVQLRVRHLSEEDLQRQIWYIDSSMSTLALAEEQVTWKGYQVFTPQVIPQRDELLTAACAVGDRLDFLALRTSTEATWIGLTLVGGRRWSLSPLGWTLYDGLPGVILFLAYLSDITQQPRYTELALLALSTLQKQLQQHRSRIKLIGAFSGWGGIIYTFTHLGALWGEAKLLAQAEAWLEEFQPLISQDKYLDLIDGAAGCLVSLLTLYKYVPKDWVLDCARACGERLLESTQPALGFAHGTAGIAWALLELAAITKIAKFREMAIQMIVEERSLFFPNEVATWCNGASGIGLGRLCSLKYLKSLDTSTRIYEDINMTLKTTLKSGFGLNHCLCHGDLGNIELLLQARENLDAISFDVPIQQMTGMILESINKNGWLCGVPLGVETPGLMTGLAGIGYGLLRLAAPESVPPVVVLAPPLK